VNEAARPLRQYLLVLRRQAWLVALVACAAVGIAALVSYLQDPVYRASMKIVVGQGGGIFQPQFGNSVEPFTQTMTNLLESDIVAGTVIDNLGLSTTPEALLRRLHVTSRTESSVLELTYNSSSKDEAVVVLSEFGSVFGTLVDQRLGSRAEGRTPGGEPLTPITASVFDPAHLEPGVVSPNPERTMVIAGVLGLALGIALAFLRDALDDRIRSRRDAEAWFGAPVIGALPKGLHVRPAHGYKPELVEALHLLRANLQFSQAGLTGPVLAVTSALPDDDHSIVAASVGRSLASAGYDVVCVEADLRQPKLARLLRADAKPVGLIDVLEDDVEVGEALAEVPLAFTSGNGRDPSRVTDGLGADGRQWPGSDGQRGKGRLRVLTAGRTPPNPADVFTRDRVARLVEQLRAHAEYVLFDTPPLLTVGDAFPVFSVSDGVVVVAREGRTRRGTAESVRSALEGLGVERVSIVLTDATANDRAYRYREETSFAQMA